MRRRDRFQQAGWRMALAGIAACAVPVFSGPAQAEAVRFLSALGNDANACTRNAPCRTLQRGVNVTPNNGGELKILDPGGYGEATIRRSITISAEGVAANVGAVVIDGANATVVLRGLLVNGRGAAASGIAIAAAVAVHIVRCEVERFPQVGIFLAAITADLFVTDSIVRLNGSAGLQVKGGGTAAQLTVDNSRFERNGDEGLLIDRINSTLTRVVSARNGSDGIAQTGGRMNITWSTAADNAGSGYNVNQGSMVLESSVARGNAANGLLNSGGSAVISNSTFTHNSTGVNTNGGGTTSTRQNNTVTGSTTINQFGPLTPLNPL